LRSLQEKEAAELAISDAQIEAEIRAELDSSEGPEPDDVWEEVRGVSAALAQRIAEVRAVDEQR